MNTPTVSVLIPVYNVERYLPRCLDSVLAQTWTDYECIVVDDGSTDNSGSICDEYARKDSRFIVIHKENGGLSSARNAAMKISSGEFLCFIDSDDYVLPNFLERLFEIQLQTKADIVKCDYFSPVPGNEKISENVTVERAIDFTEKLIRDDVGSQVCLYLSRRVLWDTFIFPTGRLVEDMLTFYKVCITANSVAITSEKLYFYFMARPDNISNSQKNLEKNLIDRALAFSERYYFSQGLYDKSTQVVLFSKAVLFFNSAITVKKPQDRRFDEDINTLRHFVRGTLLSNIFEKSIDNKTKIKAVLLAFMPNTYCRIYYLISEKRKKQLKDRA